jgi:DNA-binding transcriptional MerR regulator
MVQWGNEKPMKSGKLGQLMNKDPDTLINWTKRSELRKFFSESATVLRGQREFNESDVSVINTIRALLQDGFTFEQIAQRLEAGERVLEFPPGAAGVEGITPVEVYGAGIAKAEQLRAAEIRIHELEDKIDELQEKRMQEKADLYIKIGELQRELQMYKEALARNKKAGDIPGSS